jgi:hypothetical protein
MTISGSCSTPDAAGRHTAQRREGSMCKVPTSSDMVIYLWPLRRAEVCGARGPARARRNRGFRRLTSKEAGEDTPPVRLRLGG